MVFVLDLYFYIYCAALFIILGGFLSRMSAGGWPSTYCPIPGQWFFAIPYAIIFALKAPWYWAVVAFLDAAVGLRQATYPYTLLGYVGAVDTTRKPPLDFIVRWFFGAISPTGGQYWRNVAGLTVEGALDMAVCGALWLHFIGHGSLFIYAAGFTRAPAYMIEDYLQKKGWLPASLSGVLGDFLRGAFIYGATVLAWVF